MANVADIEEILRGIVDFDPRLVRRAALCRLGHPTVCVTSEADAVSGPGGQLYPSSELWRLLQLIFGANHPMPLPTAEGIIFVMVVTPGAVVLAEISPHVTEGPVAVVVAKAAAKLRAMLVV